MGFYIIYSLPLWASFWLIVGGTIFISLGSHYLLLPHVRKWWEPKHDNNDLNSFYLSGIGVFYGITLGLLAVGTWENFQEVEEKVTQEAASLTALYRDCNSFPSPEKELYTSYLKRYTKHTIDTAWALQKQGIVPNGGTKIITEFQTHFYKFEPKTEREKIVFQEALRQFNHFAELRRLRLFAINSGLPFIMWVVILLGAFINLFSSWMFIPETRIQGIILNVLFSSTIGLLVYSIVILDNPFRGDVAVSSEAFELVYLQFMQ